MENLEYENPFEGYAGSYRALVIEFRAAGALAKIGMPAAEPVLNKLRDFELYKQESVICCWILQGILGEKLAQARIQIAIEEIKDEKVNENLNDALSYIKTFNGIER